MFSEHPWIYIRVAVQLSPPFIPNAVLAAVVPVVNSHAILVRVVPGGHPCLTSHVLMILRTCMVHYTAHLWGWWAGLALYAMGRMGAGDVGGQVH